MTKDNKKTKGTKKNKKDIANVTPPSNITPESSFDRLSKEDQDNLTKLINSISLLGVPSKNSPETIEQILAQHNPTKDINTLAPIIIEFLKSFMLIGYTLDGERVLITYANDQQQRDALLEQLRLVFINFMNNNTPD